MPWFVRTGQGRGACPLATRFVILVLLASLLPGGALARPSAAYATYADCDEEHAAAQDVGTYGEEIAAADIPDGTYEVEARTDSYMCIFYRTYEDAENRESKEKCYIKVSQGEMTAAFYISSMYTRLYLDGDAEDAASLTDSTGTDDSAYLQGDPAEGYCPHYYTIPISALNAPISFASFAGGQYPVSDDVDSTWYTRAKWYSHVVVFKPTESVLDAIEAAEQEEQDDPAEDDSQASDPGQEEQGQDDSQTADYEGDAAPTPQSEDQPETVPAALTRQATRASDLDQELADSQAEPEDEAPNDPGVPDPDDGIDGEAGDADGGDAGEDGGGTAGETTGKRGVKVTASSMDLPDIEDAGGTDAAPAAAEGRRAVDPAAVLGLACALLFVAGAGYRAVAFAVSRRPAA